MAWRLAKCLDVLRGQVNVRWRNRDKSSDGTIGDEAHASRSSDHNPWVKDGATGVVTALDITHDPAHGLDARKLAEMLIASRDPRIKYIISNAQICSGAGHAEAWKWRAYSGTNAHRHHMHISVKPEKASYDDTAEWKLDGVAQTPAATRVSQPVLREGDQGEVVKMLQRVLNVSGAALEVDGDFGPRTLKAVKHFQIDHSLPDTGVVDALTWAALAK